MLMQTKSCNVVQKYSVTHLVQERLKIFWVTLKQERKLSSTLPNSTDEIELLIGSTILNEVFNNYRRYKLGGEARSKTCNFNNCRGSTKSAKSRSSQIRQQHFQHHFKRAAGKFKVGLTAITQLTSMIPKTVLANMNTKIILGNELASERSGNNLQRLTRPVFR